MNDFYGEEKTDIPSTSNYMKFEEGDNQFRILGSFGEGTAIQGLVYWKTTDGKRTPKRLTKKADGTFPSVPITELEVNKYGRLDTPKYFWAMPVWNYAEKKVQILEITQQSVLKSIKAYIANKKWGDPRDYDIIVNNSKEGDKTVYTVTVDPKEALSKEIVEAYTNMHINIKALFTGEDPFASSNEAEDSLENDADRYLSA